MDRKRAAGWAILSVGTALLLAEVAYMVVHAVPSALPGGIGSESSFMAPENVAQILRIQGCYSSQTLLGLVGIALCVAAVARRKPPYPILLLLGTCAFVSFTFTVLVGFELSYASTSGGLPRIDGFWYQDLTGSPEDWAIFSDVLNQGLRNMTVCALLFGLLAGSARLPVVAGVAILTALVGHPVVVSWIWGEGWLMSFSTSTVDFNGGFSIHILAGAAALAVILACRFLPPNSPRSTLELSPASLTRPTRWHPLARRQQWLLLGGVTLFILHALQVTELIVTYPAHATRPPLFSAPRSAILLGGAFAFLVTSLLKRRSGLHGLLVGCLAGWAILATGADDIPIPYGALAGAGAGLLSALLLYLLERAKFDDPTGLIPAQLVCGTIGALLATLHWTEGARLWQSTGLFMRQQSYAALATIALGFTIGGTVSLVGWLTGTLWKPIPPETP